jgi:predicted transcriptional regulator
MSITETKAFVMQVPASLAQTVEQMAAGRGHPMSVVFEQALREWVGHRGGNERLLSESLAEVEAGRVAARAEMEAWTATLDADTAPA